MKKPHYNKEDRDLMNTDTLLGAQLRLNIALKKLMREIDKKLKQILLKCENLLKK